MVAASAVCLGLQPQVASAIALGKLTVQSALGEPLRAEIEVPQITAAEADTLRTSLGSAEQFKAQGLEFPSTLGGLQIQLQRRVGGQAILQLRTERAMTEPFLDLVLDAQWLNGRLLRSYTLLLDPPAERRPASTVRMSPQGSSPAPAPVASSPAAPAVPSKPSSPPMAVTGSSAAAPTAPPTTAPPTDGEPAGTVTVQAGQTATQIANRHRPGGVSLDQMLLALLQGNPRAFIGSDVNKIKAGATLKLPDATTAKATPPEQARQALLTYSTDFNTYRRELSAIAPPVAIAPPGRSAAGAIQAQVEEKKAAAPTGDKLMLSRSGISEPDAAEAQLARDKQAREAQARVESLNQNIAALNQAQGNATGSAASPGTATPTTALGTSSPPASAEGSTSSPPAPATTAPAPGMAASAGLPATPPADVPSWSRNPLIPFAAGSFSALLLSYGVFRFLHARQSRVQSRKSFLQQAAELSASIATPEPVRAEESTAAPETPPAPEPNTASAREPTPERPMVNGSVDPVAEADVYLAYGREQQAEDILNDALRRTPGRTSIHAKLAEIYAARRDHEALRQLQAEVLRWSNGAGPDWERVLTLAQSLESGTPDRAAALPPPPPQETAVPSVDASLVAPSPAPRPTGDTAASPPVAQDESGLLPMEFSLSSAPLPSQAARKDAQAPTENEPASLQSPDPQPPASLIARMALPSLDLVPPAAPPALAPSESTAPPEPLDTGMAMTEAPRTPLREPETVTSPPEGLALDFTPMDFPSPPPSSSAPTASSKELAPPREARAPLELDLQGLALELDSLSATLSPPPPAEAAPPLPELPLHVTPPTDRLATKLALAAEFKAIGDIDGTRSLLQEVATEARGELQTRAQQMLAELG